MREPPEEQRTSVLFVQLVVAEALQMFLLRTTQPDLHLSGKDGKLTSVCVRVLVNMFPH